MNILLMIICALVWTALFAYQIRFEPWEPVERVLNLIMALLFVLGAVGAILFRLGVIG